MKIKRLVSIIISLAMILCLFFSCGKNDSSLISGADQQEEYKYEFRDLAAPKYIEPASAFAGGDGSAGDPYQISSASELAFMQSVFANDEVDENYVDANYVLTADIELNSTENFDSWKSNTPEFSWKPIESVSFKGVFDGNGHTVSGLYINLNREASDSEHYGLFGNIGGTIKNVNIADSYFAVSGYTNQVGSVAGYANLIENCTSAAVIDCFDSTCGGLAGTAQSVVSCIFNGEINQIKEKSPNYIGGIAGVADNAKNCINNGIINFGANDVDAVGGVVGKTGEGVIDSCVNNGTVNGDISENTALAIAGGIVGKVFVMVLGGEEKWSKGVTVKNCTNNGEVSSHYYAGGIIGEVNNDRNPNCIVVENCINKASVKAKEYTGGVVGALTCHGKASGNDNILIKNCTNSASLNKGTVGGVIGYFGSNEGQTTIRGCTNTADLSSDSQHCAGIVAYWLMGSTPSVIVKVTDCINSGNITSPLNAGGIFSYADAPVLLDEDRSCMIDIENCSNSGNITTKSNNSYIGGISGNWGMRGISTDFIYCKNSGDLIIDNPGKPQGFSDEEGNKVMTISRIAGGIIGRAGDGLLLTTDSDNVKDKNVNTKKAVITLTSCSNVGALSVNDAKEYTNKNGEKVYRNYFGGIIGNTTGEKDASIFVEDCTYSNFERGLGNTDVKDIGTKN